MDEKQRDELDLIRLSFTRVQARLTLIEEQLARIKDRLNMNDTRLDMQRDVLADLQKRLGEVEQIQGRYWDPRKGPFR